MLLLRFGRDLNPPVSVPFSREQGCHPVSYCSILSITLGIRILRESYWNVSTRLYTKSA